MTGHFGSVFIWGEESNTFGILLRKITGTE